MISEVTPGKIAEAIDLLIRDARGRVVLAEQGHKFVARTHSAQKRAAELDDLRTRLLERVKRV